MVPVAVLALALVFAFVPAASAHPGDVDSSFGAGGWTGVTTGPPSDAFGIIRRPDAALITGSDVSGGAIFQTEGLTRNGQPLPGYGSAGVGSITIPGALSAAETDMASEPDGRVIVVGYTNPSATSRFVVTRFRLNGSPDASFSGDGVAKFGFPQGPASGYGVAVQPNGKIVVVGEVDPASGVSNPAVIRLNPNGTLDKTFGDKGRKVLRVPDHVAGYDSPWRVAIGPAGNLVMAGWELGTPASNDYRTLVMRLRPNGAPDPTFSGDGFVVLDAGGTANYAESMVLDGPKVLVGLSLETGDAGFLRLLGNGKRDPSFGGGDGLATHMESGIWAVGGLAVTSDHRIVGTNIEGGAPDVVRLLPGGGLDSGFGVGGLATGLVPNSDGLGLVILPVGKIVVVGRSSTQVIVTRFLGH